MAASDPGDTVRDLWLRLLVSPVLGAGIANGSGIIDHQRYTLALLAGHYVLFAVVAFVIWECNRRLYLRLRQRWSRDEASWRRAVRLGATLVFSTVVATVGLLLAWRALSGDPSATPPALALAVLLSMTAVAVITHGYETIFLWRDWQSERLRGERLERARLQAELDALQRGSDPHFLYNHLNSLAHLIEQAPDRALAFVDALAAGYRYLLDTRQRPFVTLSEELAALERCRELATIRFGGAVSVEWRVSELEAASWWVPPLCLPELLENAIKHTAFDRARPLVVSVAIEGDTLVVSNRYEPPPVPVTSTGFGLANLDERLRLAIGRPLRWGVEDGWFRVRTPLVRTPPETSRSPG